MRCNVCGSTSDGYECADGGKGTLTDCGGEAEVCYKRTIGK